MLRLGCAIVAGRARVGSKQAPRIARPLATTPERSALMKRVRREGTEPEQRVRRYLHASGLRFARTSWGLPGTPDIVLPHRSAVVFVHGCFWHGHDCPHGAVQAKSNKAYWASKIADNRARDRRKARALRDLGWIVEVIWECETEQPRRLEALARRLLRR